jgi:transposase
MTYFNTGKFFLVPSLDLQVKERLKMIRFLSFLDNSKVGDIISNYINNNTFLGGRPGYNYYRLFATILYGFAFGRFTLRNLEDACKYDLRYIFLMEQTTPSYTTFCHFINKVIVPNEEEIFGLINAAIQKEIGIDFEDAFIDGTKYEANANKYKFVWKPTTFHKKLSIKVNNLIKTHNLIHNYNDEFLIRSSTVAYAITHLHEKKNSFDHKTYASLTKAFQNFLYKVIEYEEKEEICGPNRNSYYKTDTDATAMTLKHDYYSGLGSNMHAAYNIQLLVIKGFIFSYHVSQKRSDINAFIDVIERFAKLYGCFPMRICADAGYGSLNNYRYLHEHRIQNYVKHASWEGNASGTNPDCYHLNDDDTITCLNGNIGYEVELDYRHARKANSAFYKVEGCLSCPWMPFCKKFMRKQDENFKIFEIVKEFERLKHLAHSNLCSTKGIELRVNRSIQVEGVIGITKQNYGYTRARRRGIAKVSTEMMLNALGLNIAKLFRFYETGKLNAFWTIPNDLKPQEFKKPSLKKLVKKGSKINKNVVHNNNKAKEKGLSEPL